MIVEPLVLRVELVGIQRDDDTGDVRGMAPMWEGQIFPFQFKEIPDLITDALVEHDAEIPAGLIERS